MAWAEDEGIDIMFDKCDFQTETTYREYCSDLYESKSQNYIENLSLYGTWNGKHLSEIDDSYLNNITKWLSDKAYRIPYIITLEKRLRKLEKYLKNEKF